MEKEYSKLDEHTLQITGKEMVEKTSTYVYNDLVSTRDALVEQKAKMNEEMDVKIADAQSFIDAADELGIIAQ